MKIVPSLIIVLSALYFNLSYAQANFKSGFIIKNGGEKVNCLILEEDWKYNPTTFTYKLEDSNGVLTGTLSEIEAFGVESSFKYIKKEDFLPEETLKNPVFLNVLLEGEVSIYQYRSKDDNLFFYKASDDNRILELIYIDSNRKQDADTTSRTLYRSQLYKALGEDNTQLSAFKDLNYKKNEILRIVTENTSKNRVYSKFYDTSKDRYKFYLKAGSGTTPVAIHKKRFGEFVDFGNVFNFRFAAELEYFFPSRSEQWSIMVSPVIKHQNTEETISTSTDVIENKYTYTAFEMQFGARYYFTPTTNDSRFYTNAGLLVEIPLLSELEFGDEKTDVGIFNTLNLYAGIGYQYKRFGAELVYIPNLKILTTNSEYSVEFDTLAFQLTYSLF